MPVLHDFQCAADGCDAVIQNVLTNGGDPFEPLTHCERPMQIMWEKLPFSAQVFEAFTTRNIHPDGKPLLVRNKGDLLRYASEYGVRHVDDPDLVAQGSEIVRRSAKIGKIFDFGHHK